MLDQLEHVSRKDDSFWSGATSRDERRMADTKPDEHPQLQRNRYDTLARHGRDGDGNCWVIFWARDQRGRDAVDDVDGEVQFVAAGGRHAEANAMSEKAKEHHVGWIRYGGASFTRRVLIAMLAAGMCLISGPELQTHAQQQPSPATGTPDSNIVQIPAQRQARQRQPQGPSVLRAQSELVRIDVEVTDKRGQPIKGLRADQFVVTDNGRAQK